MKSLHALTEVTLTDCNSGRSLEDEAVKLLSLYFENTALTKKSKVYSYLHINLFHCKIYQELDKNVNLVLLRRQNIAKVKD